MKTPTPTLDSTHPRWIEGERAANVLLDLGLLDAGTLSYLISSAELRADIAASSGNNDTFLQAHGFLTALRERREEMST